MYNKNVKKKSSQGVEKNHKSIIAISFLLFIILFSDTFPKKS